MENLYFGTLKGIKIKWQSEFLKCYKVLHVGWDY